MAVMGYGGYDQEDSPRRGETAQKMVNWAGALISVALILGVAIWGYRLAVRDVTGVPVVRALEGPMRIAPEDPGGRLASHQGLAVNAVAADGEAAPPADRLVLAPQPLDLSEEDETYAALRAGPLRDAAALAAAADAEGPVNSALSEDPDAPALEADEAHALALAIAEELSREGPPEVPAAQSGATTAGAVAVSRRPAARPARAATAASVAGVTPAAAQPAASPAPQTAAVQDINPDSLPAGTRLVQLGAFDDDASARREWERLSNQFSAYLQGKSRVIQAAESGGRTFYRLRAHGFADEADAQRFCSALLAEQAACIPVLIR